MGWCIPSVSHTRFVRFHSCSAKTTAQVLWLSNHWRLLRRSAPTVVRTPRIHAINDSDSLSVAVKSPAATGDYSVFLTVSAAFFFLYWIANFVVPDMITKDFQSKDSGEKQVGEERIPSEDEK